MARKREKGIEHWLLMHLVNYMFSAHDSGFPSISILHRVSTEGHVERPNRPGHKILCKEMTREQRLVQPAFNSLEDGEKNVVIVKYMPYLIDERVAIDRERAKFMGMTLRTFRTIYYRAAKKVKKRLT